MRRWFWLVVSTLLGAGYVTYVVWSKYAKDFGPPPIRLSEPEEFLLFLAAVAVFTLHIIVNEDPRAS